MQLAYRGDTLYPSQPGAIADSGHHDVISLINQNPQASQVDTLTIATVTDSTAYTIVIDGVSISYTSDATATEAEIQAGLIAAVRDQPALTGLFTMAISGSTVVFTARYPGVGWTMTESDAKMTLAHTTANDAADPVGYGLAVLREATTWNSGRLCKSANLTAKALTLTPVVANDTIYHVHVTMPDGTTYLSDYTSDATATAKEIVEGVAAAVNATMPASTVVATEDDALVTLTAEVNGQSFEVSYDEALWAYADTASAFTEDINEVFAGVSVNQYSSEVATDDTNSYAGNSVMSVMSKGRIVVQVEAAVTIGSPVYVRIAGTGTNGAFSKTKTAGEHILVKGAKWHKPLNASLAVLELG